MKIHFFSFNMGGTHSLNWGDDDTSRELNSFLKKRMNPSKPEMWCFCTQEDASTSIFMQSIGSLFLEYGYKEYNSKSLLSSIDVVDGFHAHMSVFASKCCIQTPATSPIRILTHARTNGAVHKTSTLMDVGGITFVGSHFPFNPLCQRCFKSRIKALRDVLVALQYRGTQLAFVVGDLNFRDIPVFHKKKTIIKKQIEYAIESLSKIVRDLHVQDITANTGITCKMVKMRKQGCLARHNLDFDSLKPNMYDCIHPKRYPSQCDRVLCVTKIHQISNQSKVSVMEKQILEFPPINQSDHNAVYVAVNIS